LNLNELCEQAHSTAVSKGWYDNDDYEEGRNIGEALALIHSEVSEALEEVRKGKNLTEIYTEPGGKPAGFPVELADVIIRIADLCGYLGINLEEAVHTKMNYNETRPYRHGGKLV
jgi:NTP pyrophosphatase (non-canonical NTP hydrolase)